jgi:hypothetical protein
VTKPELEKDSEIRVYVTPDRSRAGNLKKGQPLSERFADRVEELGQGLGEIANDLRDQLDATLADDDRDGWGLEEVQLTFSLSLEAGAGVMVAKASTAAGFEASMTWKRRRPSDGG